MKLSRLLAALASLSLVSVVPIQHAEGQCLVNEDAKLTASDAAEDDQFGNSVSISGDVAVVGAPGNDDAGFFSGSAYVYRFDGSTWVEEQKLSASDAADGDRFGSAVSISGDVVLVGAFFSDDAGIGAGSAYIFRFDGNTWVEEQKLTASDAAEGDSFGISVSVSGNVAVIGAERDDDGGSLAGSAYVYRFDGSTWVEEQKLTASDAAEGDFSWRFGVRQRGRGRDRGTRRRRRIGLGVRIPF